MIVQSESKVKCGGSVKRTPAAGRYPVAGARLSSVDCFKQKCYKQQQIRSRFKINRGQCIHPLSTVKVRRIEYSRRKRLVKEKICAYNEDIKINRVAMSTPPFRPRIYHPRSFFLRGYTQCVYPLSAVPPLCGTDGTGEVYAIHTAGRKGYP